MRIKKLGIRTVFRRVGVITAVCFAVATFATSQIRPIYDQGALGLAQLLKRINSNASVLMIGAHPDDEDTALLAYLARGENARTAYLSLTRGDGGQNIIGPELGEALGVIRTEELLQARKLDGAEQFFTSAYDYGFSKTLAEAKQKWDEKIILCNVVRVIRAYRPLVVISQFTGTAADGHGQHQYAGYISPIAVKAAADSSQCKYDGDPWTVQKFYVRERGTGEKTLRINTGKYDPLLGRSYFEIAMQARSQHRSQEQGVLELKGDQFSNLTLVSTTGRISEKETGIFDGIDVAKGALTAADLSYDFSSPSVLTASLIKLSRPPSPHDAAITEALLRANGIRIDVLADRETVVAGESFPVAIRLFTPRPDEIRLIKSEFNLSNVQTEEPPASPATFRREVANLSAYYTLTVPSGVGPTVPSYLQEGRIGDLFIPPGRNSSLYPIRAFEDPAAYALLTLKVSGETVTVKLPVEYRFADDVRGEIRREVNIVPKVSVSLDRPLLIVSKRSQRLDREIAVSLANNASGAIRGRAKLIVPPGWKVSPAGVDFSMDRKDEKTSVKFSVTIPESAERGSHEINAEALVGGEQFMQTMQTISYEHIQTHRIYRPAKADVKVIDLQTVPVKVGYIRGSGDRVAEAVKQLGVDVEEIDAPTLASGNLGRFDTIVVGIRAYQVRPDLVANNKRLLDFASNGGTLIVQYQLPPSYAQRSLTPFPTQMGPRVVDENATVTISEPTHPVFNFPNKITAEDFTSWVQERNLYNFVQMDPKYVGLLESHDTGEPANKGGLVIADIGKGKYVYCSYSLFRQLPAGVPGAYRLLANLISLPHSAQKAN